MNCFKDIPKREFIIQCQKATSHKIITS